jgi:hypothetical protein
MWIGEGKVGGWTCVNSEPFTFERDVGVRDMFCAESTAYSQLRAAAREHD